MLPEHRAHDKPVSGAGVSHAGCFIDPIRRMGLGRCTGRSGGPSGRHDGTPQWAAADVPWSTGRPAVSSPCCLCI